MKSKSLDSYFDRAIALLIMIVVLPFWWLYEKYEYYSKERGRLCEENAFLRERVSTLEKECKHYKHLYTDGDYWRSECARLRKILLSRGYSKKKIGKIEKK